MTASPHGDSVDSSGRPGAPTVCEPNTADNLLLFDGDHDLPGGERSSLQPSRRSNIAPSEQSSQIDGTQNAKESEDSAVVRPYARRNRSRSNREGARSNAIDMGQNRSGQGTTLPVRGGVRDAKVHGCEKNNQKDQNMPSNANPKSASSNGDITPKVVASDNQLDREVDGARVPGITTGPIKASLQESKLDVMAPKKSLESQNTQPSQVNVQQTPTATVSKESDVGEKEQLDSSGLERLPCGPTPNTEKETTSSQLNGFSDKENANIVNEVQNGNAAVGTKGLDSESFCTTQNSLGFDVHKDSDICINAKNIDSNGTSMGKTSDVDDIPDTAAAEPVKAKDETEAVNEGASINDDPSSVCQNHSESFRAVKVDKDMQEGVSELQSEGKILSNSEGVQQSDHVLSESDGKPDDPSNNNSSMGKENSAGRCQDPVDVSMQELPDTTLPEMHSTVVPDPPTISVNSLKVADKAHEDSILEEARIIEVLYSPLLCAQNFNLKKLVSFCH